MGRSFQMATDPANGNFVRRLCTPVKVKRLSQAALEVLAIIAYRQPVTKGEIEAIRGIRCDRVVEGLRQKDLIREWGGAPGGGPPDSLRNHGHISAAVRLRHPGGTAGDQRYRRRHRD